MSTHRGLVRGQHPPAEPAIMRGSLIDADRRAGVNRLRRFGLAVCLVVGLCVPSRALAAPAFTPVSGSPFTTGRHPATEPRTTPVRIRPQAPQHHQRGQMDRHRQAQPQGPPTPRKPPLPRPHPPLDLLHAQRRHPTRPRNLRPAPHPPEAAKPAPNAAQFLGTRRDTTHRR